MLEYEFDVLIYIGRFHPKHKGHEHVLEQAFRLARKVAMLVGSTNKPRSIKNPWTFDERKQMIMSGMDGDQINRLIIRPVADFDYQDNRWLAEVQNIMEEVVLTIANGGTDEFQAAGTRDLRVGLIGFDKDESTFYLKKFPQWETVPISESWGTVSATDIRENYFQKAPGLPMHLVSPPVMNFLQAFMLTPEFKYLLGEYESARAARDLRKSANLPPWFDIWAVTADAVVTQSGHILLTTRGEAPFKGLLALPGGHVDPRAGDSRDNAVKELWEETQPMDAISKARGDGKPMPMNRLYGFLTGDERRFDAPGRDPRGHYITTAFRFEFPDGPLFDVRGGDDAAHAAWYPIGSIKPEQMAFDHYAIIQTMLGGGR